MAVNTIPESSDFSFGSGISTLFLESCFYANPIGSVLSIFSEAIRCFATTWQLNDEIHDKNSTTFQVKHDRIESLTDLLVQRKVTILGNGVNQAAIEKLKTGLKEIYRESLITQLEIIQKLAVKTGVQPDFYIEIEKENSTDTSITCPYQAVGSRLFGNTPVILFEPLEIKCLIESSSEEKIDQLIEKLKDELRGNTAMKEFFIAHEFSHITHDDPLKSFLNYFVKDAITVAVWALGFFRSSTWLGYFLGSFGVSALVQMAGILSLRLFSVRQELRADREAVEQLGTAEGAIQCFSKSAQVVLPDPYHPTPQERLKACTTHMLQRVSKSRV